MTDDTGFVEGLWGTEGADHVRLKNLAVMILLSEGFSLDQIQEEARIDGSNPIDVVAEQEDGSLVMIECETRTANPPPMKSDVSYSHQHFKNGHQVFALTRDGLFELCDRRGYHFRRCQPIQTALQTGNDRELGRWFANHHATGSIPYVEEDHRRSAHGRRPATREDIYVTDNHERWRANGEKPRESQPSYWELADPDFSRDESNKP